MFHHTSTSHDYMTTHVACASVRCLHRRSEVHHFLATDWAFAPLTASRNSPAAAGAATRPSSAARVVTLRPYMARLERLSARTNAPLNVNPTNAPLARE